MSDEPERGIMGSVIIRLADYGEFFALRESARQFIREQIDVLPAHEAVILDWTGVQAITGAFAAEFTGWFLRTTRRIGSQGMTDDVRVEIDTACRRLER
jgi:hypothetical protein